MGKGTVAFLAFGAVVAAAITAYVLNVPFRKGSPFSLLLYLAFLLPAMFVAWLVADLMRRQRLRDWCVANGTIQSCDEGPLDRGIQSYRCAYVFRPDDTRQGGTFLISETPTNSDARLYEIRKKLLGYRVRVRYDPKDYTRCMVEDEKVLDWDVENDR